MSPIDKALVEFKKAQIEFMITLLDQQAVVMALKSTVLELGGTGSDAIYERHHVVEMHKRAEERREWQTVVQTLQTILDKFPSPKTPVN